MATAPHPCATTAPEASAVISGMRTRRFKWQLELVDDDLSPLLSPPFTFLGAFFAFEVRYTANTIGFAVMGGTTRFTDQFSVVMTQSDKQALEATCCTASTVRLRMRNGEESWQREAAERRFSLVIELRELPPSRVWPAETDARTLDSDLRIKVVPRPRSSAPFRATDSPSFSSFRATDSSSSSSACSSSSSSPSPPSLPDESESHKRRRCVSLDDEGPSQVILEAHSQLLAVYSPYVLAKLKTGVGKGLGQGEIEICGFSVAAVKHFLAFVYRLGHLPPPCVGEVALDFLADVLGLADYLQSKEMVASVWSRILPQIDSRTVLCIFGLGQRYDNSAAISQCTDYLHTMGAWQEPPISNATWTRFAAEFPEALAAVVKIIGSTDTYRRSLVNLTDGMQHELSLTECQYALKMRGLFNTAMPPARVRNSIVEIDEHGTLMRLEPY